jgi:hypothetical protein
MKSINPIRISVFLSSTLFNYNWGGVDAWNTAASTRRSRRSSEVISYEKNVSSKQRRLLVSGFASLFFGSETTKQQPVFAAETIGKDPNCIDISCVGVWDGILADCPYSNSILGAGCVSSQDDTPGNYSCIRV